VRRWAIAAAILALIFGGVSLTEATGVTQLAPTLIRVLTPSGTLVIETADPGVKVTIEGDGGLVVTGASSQEVRLKPGSYKVQAAKEGRLVRVAQDLVTITRRQAGAARRPRRGLRALERDAGLSAVARGHGTGRRERVIFVPFPGRIGARLRTVE
jgi:hypothetical protein